MMVADHGAAPARTDESIAANCSDRAALAGVMKIAFET
jgi:hypothetical protein